LPVSEASQIPVEQTVLYKDTGGSTLRTVTKAWFNQYELGCELKILDNGLISGAFSSYGSGGQVTDRKEYDYGIITSTSGCQQGAITPPSGTASRETVANYQSFANTPIFPSGPSIFDRPSSVIVYGNGNRAAETDLAYDQAGTKCALYPNCVTPTAHDEANYAPGSTAPRGNATTITKLCFQGSQSCTPNSVSTYTFDETGQVLSMIDPCGNATCGDMSSSNHTTMYSYADNYDSPPSSDTDAYLTQITDALGHTTEYKYAFSDGQLIQSTDKNSQVTGYVYNDALRRLTETDFPDTGKTTVSYNDSPPSPSVTTCRLISSGRCLTTLTVMDAMGHTVETLVTPDPDCLSGDRTDTTYDGLGRVYTVSNPYCSTSDQTYGRTTHVYDALGRTTQVTEPDNTSTVLTTYTGRATQVQDEGNGSQRVTRISQSDGLGRLTSVCEVSSASLIGSGGTPASCGLDIAGTGFVTTYQYDALDNLLQVNQNGIATRTFGYDSFSRLTSASNPESGSIGYTYDANGNVATKTDARNITITHTYSALNQLTGKTYSDGTPAVTFNYNETSARGVALTNTKGRLSSESTAGSLQTGAIFSYDPMGRITDNSQCTPQNCGTGVFTIQYPQYDFLGDLLSGTNAAGVTFSYSYNTVARLTGISSNFVDPSHPGTLLSSAHYTPFGAPASSALGNGIGESFGYDKRLRQQSYSATSGGTTQYSFNISSFAPNSDILSANDSVNRTWTYSYDEMNRLCNANQSSTQPLCHQSALYTYVYDRFGNRWQQNGPQSFVTTFTGNNPSNPQNNNRMDGYSYDAAGNLLNDGTHGYSYDAENRLTNVDNGTTARYVYNAEGRRVRKATAASTLDFLYDTEGHKVAEVDSTGTFLRGELFAAGRHFAVFAPDPGPTGATFFVHSDWLGTERARTNMAATVCETITSLPFGDGQTISDSCGDSSGDVSPLHFTGKERDAESGLDNFTARYFGSSLGRFMTPDPMGGHQEDPQTLNKYAYVRNNPVTLTDPTGLDFNLNCDKNNGTTCQGGHQYYQDKNGDYKETVVKSDDKGNLTDQSGNKYSGTVDAGGVHFSSDGGKTSSTGSWVDRSNETKFTQQTGALAGFRFVFSQPGKGQSFSGTFSTDTNFYGAKSALKNAGFSVSYLDQCCNLYEMYHNWSLINFRSAGDSDTGQNSVHFLVNPGDKVGLVVPTTGKFHGYETNPNTDPLGHLRKDLPW
jgi:RHS repeat-associated protein